ncbi:MAG: TIM44-like domain-containing protein [Desulfovibrionaceae bacterium]
MLRTGLVGLAATLAPVLARAAEPVEMVSAQGGAFSRGILPLIFIGILIYVALRIFGRRPGGRGGGPFGGPGTPPGGPRPGSGSGSGRPSGPGDYSHPDDPENLRDAYSRARASWEWLSGEPGRDTQAGPAMPVPAGGPAPFDAAEFLEGAKAAYGRIRHALASGDRDDARQFADDAALDALVGGADPASLPGEVLLVNARLLETKTIGGHTTASVYYDATAKALGQGQPVSLREVWRFGCDDDNPDSHWRLEAVLPAEPALA